MANLRMANLRMANLRMANLRMANLRMAAAVATSLAALCLGCTGGISSDASAGLPPGAAPPGTVVDPNAPPGMMGAGGTPVMAGEFGTKPFRRLTKSEYTNTVRDLLQIANIDELDPAASFPPDTDSAKSGFAMGGLVAGVDAGRLIDAAAQLSADAMARIGSFVPCTPIPTDAAAQDECARQFITQFGRRAFRRPLLPDEQTELFTYYTTQRTEVGNDFPNAIRSMIAAMLLSPKFLYRWEVTPQTAIVDGDLVRFNSHEMASRLSYTLWATMPDDALFAAADTDQLATPEQIAAQARRMLADPKAKDAMGDFFVQWLEAVDLLELTKNTMLFADYSREAAEAMLDDTKAFAANLMIDGDGRLETLLTSSTGFASESTASFYGVQGVAGAEPQPVQLDPTQRAGILTHPSFLASHGSPTESHPVKRGKMIIDRVLCRHLELPDDLVPEPIPPAPDLQTRERYEQHGQQACAIACHSIMDPLGFAFENYDAVGGYRTMDAGRPVNASGKITLEGVEHTFNNAVEFSQALAASDEVRACITRQWTRFALRRHEVAGDEAAIAAALAAFEQASYDMREILVALTQTRSFTHRAPTPGEVLQ